MTKYQELRPHFPTAMQQKVVELGENMRERALNEAKSPSQLPKKFQGLGSHGSNSLKINNNNGLHIGLHIACSIACLQESSHRSRSL